MPMENKMKNTVTEEKTRNVNKNKKDVIVIKNPFKNVWQATTIILFIALLLMIFLYANKDYQEIKEENSEISGNDAGKILTEFLNERADNNVAYVSSQDLGNIYEITISYLGQQIPAYTTKDGKYFIQTIIPLTSSLTGNSISEGNEKVRVSEDDDAFLGNKNAEVTIIEFSDYECPFCLKFYTETLPLLKKDYIDTGKVKLVYRDFPLDIHPNAQKSAEAAECVRAVAGSSNEAYFKMHDIIFKNQQQLSNEALKKWAKDLGYNIDSCLDSGKMEQEVLKDLQDGLSYGVSGTPGFFINGKVLEGAQPYSVFKQIIDGELNK